LLLGYLEEHGYVVVASALSASEVEEAKSKLWAWLTASAGMVRRDPSTWCNHFYAVGNPSTGIMHAKGVGHANHSWFVRSRARVVQAFQTLWGDDDLLCSFDGGNVFRPWHCTAAEMDAAAGAAAAAAAAAPKRVSRYMQDDPANWKTRGGWFHLDQGRCKPNERVCVQGLVTLFDASAATGGLTVVDASHRDFARVVAEYATSDGDFVALPPNAPIVATGERRLVAARAGDLLLWDSRTLHCNSPAVLPPSAPSDELLRAVSYVCMTPRRFASEEVLAQRQAAYVDSITTSHWPHEFRAAQMRPPVGLAKNDPAAASATVRALVGF
jgi:hypothetical protein